MKHQLLHHQLKQSIFSRTISQLIPPIFFCVSGYMYFIFELGTGLFRWDCNILSCLDTWRKVAMQFLLSSFPPPTIKINCNIVTTTKNQYIDYLMFLVIPSLCWDASIEVIDYVSVWRFGLHIETMSGCRLTSYMRTQYFMSFYIAMNILPVVYWRRYKRFVSTSLTAKYNTKRAINSILWNWIPKPKSFKATE